MKIVKEYIFESFKEDSDPIEDMGIGIKTQILNDLKRIGINKEDIIFKKDNTFFFENPRLAPDTFLDIQLKYFPENKRKLLYNLEKTNKPINIIIDQAVLDKIPVVEIEYIVNYSLSTTYYNHPRYTSLRDDRNQAKIYLSKLKRTKKQVKEEDENNIYVFIGYDDKVPITINSKRYYEDKFMAEKLVKIDKYNVSDLNTINAMKLRANMTHHGKVYMITVPKDFMDEDYYDGIPEEARYVIEKYKKLI